MTFLVKNVRLNFPSLFEKKEGPNGSKAKYQTEAIIQKGSEAEKLLKAEYDKCCQATLADPKKGAKARDLPPFTRSYSSQPGILIDCDADTEKYPPEHFENCWILRAKSDFKPIVIEDTPVGRIRMTGNEDSEIRSGTVGDLGVHFYYYDAGVNKGITCGLDGFRKTGEGVPIGGGRPSEDQIFGAHEPSDWD